MAGYEAEEMLNQSDEYDSEDGGFIVSGPSVVNSLSTEATQCSSSTSPPGGSASDFNKSNPGVSESWFKTLRLRGIDQDELHVLKYLHENLEAIWSSEKPSSKREFSVKLKKFLTSAVNPFTSALFLIDSCRDFKFGKTTTISFAILKDFDKWLQGQTPKRDRFKKLDQSTRENAFYIATHFHTNFLELFVKCFDLKHPGNEYCLPQINFFLGKQKYKEAAQCASRLGLQHHFTLRQIVIPLLLQDKLNLIESYVYGQPDEQLALVKLLDHLCDRSTDLTELTSSMRHTVPNMRGDKLHFKPLSKLAIRLMKLYGIPTETCPNINNARRSGALRYLLYKKYIEKSLGEDNWEELIQGSVGENDWLLIEQLIDQLIGYGEMGEAVKWTRIYKIPDEKLTPDVVEARQQMDSTGSTVSEAVTEDWGDDCYSEEHIQSFYHSLSLPLSDIHLIDSPALLSQCLPYLSQTPGILGVDSEWRPAFGTQVTSVALLQLALKDVVYLIDIHVLLNSLQPQDWEKFLLETFCNPDIIKLGYGLEADMQMLLKTLPNLKSTFEKATRLVDVEKLAKHVMRDFDEDISSPLEGATGGTPYSHDDNMEEDDSMATFSPPKQPLKSEEKGLSELVRRCLGKPLSKCEQMSDWQRRPLRPAQFCYAALDAFVLLDVYDNLVSRAKALKKPIDLEPKVGMKWLGKSKKDKFRSKIRGDKKEQPKSKAKTEKSPLSQVNSAPRRSPISPHDLAVVVDSMLQGLGKQLRSCGIDVRILENHEDTDTAIEIFLRENRIILTTRGPFDKVRSYVGDHNCFCVSHDQKARAQAIEVLNHFNVTVSKADIFSRCCVCNGDYYIQIPTFDMKQLWLKKQEHLCKIPKGSVCYPGLFRFPIDFETVTLIESGAQIQIDTVVEAMFGKIETFFVCGNCGKVFWEGTHFEKICENFADVLEIEPNGKTVYQSS